ncbi:UNVERIFIED_CONTAM: hypothetical protein NCL1_51150 [Trichonephila clavipes]
MYPRIKATTFSCDHGRLVVKLMNSWSESQVLEPSNTEDLPCRGAISDKSVEEQASFRR